MDKFIDKTDEEVVVLAKMGDDEAFEEIINRYKETVRIRAASYFIDGGDRDDLIQEGMIGLFRAVKDFNSEKEIRFTTFAGLCIDRQIVSAVRKASSLKNDPLNRSVPIPEGDFEAGGSVLSAEEVVFGNLAAAEMKAGLRSVLSPMENRILDLLLVGKTYREIAELERISPKSSDNAIQRIKKKAREVLDRD